MVGEMLRQNKGSNYVKSRVGVGKKAVFVRDIN